ncbi:hypothetical protein FK178_14695 [Antarcticibacterium arcticum]|uniref:Uncharacterized protein n=1 Tax=Antarcticibacterium arcticum TaxID=2585771 RepID=A0A5B8YLL0_9FLAO|nr:hypothetical protein [Antarcticibacterium arcticum]QED38890.1 hypothetical protein FK178_14695 [Antarcticibacterium arcticum]
MFFDIKVTKIRIQEGNYEKNAGFRPIIYDNDFGSQSLKIPVFSYIFIKTFRWEELLIQNNPTQAEP